MQPDLIFGFVVLIISVILHEVAHGYMANYLGDPTAKLAGRLTLNPLAHIDPVGTLLLPLILTLTHSPFFIGYAKPVPVNPYNLPGKYDTALVSFAGPATNIALAVFFGLIIRFGGVSLDAMMLNAFAIIVYVNLLLALFNLIPIPPLDGSGVLSGILAAISRTLEEGYNTFMVNFQRLGLLPMILIILFIFNFLLLPFFSSFLGSLFFLLTGVSL